MTTILALDPGPVETGWVQYRSGRVLACGVAPNREILAGERKAGVTGLPSDLLAIEMIASYGMAVGREVFQTCVWIGRFQQAWHNPEAVLLIERKEIKLALCGSARAKDANIRQRLLDLVGPRGTKKAPGPTYGVKSHAWSALAVAVVAAGMREVEA